MSKRATVAWVLVAGVVAGTVVADPQPATDGAKDRYARWLDDVGLLISDAEREVFAGLGEDYQREEFIRRFWRVRDPYPQTPRNEFQELWEARLIQARELLGDQLDGDPARMLLTFGAPSRRQPISCEITETLDIWYYDDGSELVRGFFNLVFVGYRPRRGDADLWQPVDGLRDLMRFGAGTFSGADTDPQLAQLILRDCPRGDDIVAALSQTLDLSDLERRGATLLPRPNDEWVQTFKARSTDIPEDAELMPGEIAVDFPGRHQSRTVVQGVVTVPRAAVGVNELGSHRSLDLLVDGDVLRQGELFDQFRYRFDFPAEGAPETLPLVIQRYLRPGPYELVVKVQDVASKRVYREVVELEVPRVEAGRQPVVVEVAGERQTASTEPEAVLRARPLDPAGVEALLGEANAAISTGDHSVKVLALPDVLTVGKVRVEATVSGPGIARVSFVLNGRPVMRKTRPPYSVELDLGDQPRVHTIKAVALDADNRRLASDEVLINAGPHRFAIRLIEPQAGHAYQTSVRARAEVEVPEGEKLDRVELFLNDTRVATLYQPPFEQPLLIQGETGLAYVRSVAYLQNGESTEDVVFVNAPDYVDEMRVHFVELFATVTDRRGDFVEDLEVGELRVVEDGQDQEVRRFEKMRDLPIRAGLVIDTSMSMQDSLTDVKKAAHRFLSMVIAERDRAALITFNDEPRLVVRFTHDQEILAGGLAELVTEGETALYDSLIYGLHYFSGLRGKRALVVLTDGEDSSSHYSYTDAIDFARRTGVAVYFIGLGLPSDPTVRSQLQQISRETGGECYFIDRASQLERIYETIQIELRSQYLIAYQSSQVNSSDDFRRVEVEVSRKGVEVRTIRGYFP